MKKSAKLRNLLTVAALTLVIALLVPEVASAATYTYTIGNTTRSIAVVNGKTTLVVGNETYVLTNELVAADAGLDENGVSWILFKNGAIKYWYYDVDKKTVPIKLHQLLDAGGNQVYAEKLMFGGTNTAYVIGYVKSGTNYKQPSLDEVKKALGVNSTSSSGNGNNNNTSGTNTTTSSTAKSTGLHVVCTENGYFIYDGTKQIAKATLSKSGKMTYSGYSKEKIAKIGYIKKSQNLIYRTESGKVVVINHKTMKAKTIVSKGATSFIFDTNGFVLYVVTNKPSKIKVTAK